jgi:hypothetical protein
MASVKSVGEDEAKDAVCAQEDIVGAGEFRIRESWFSRELVFELDQTHSSHEPHVGCRLRIEDLQGYRKEKKYARYY